jgi:predicted metal-dependent hydrolase
MNVQVIKKDVKHLSLKVKPNGEVTLTVPKDTTDNDIEYVLKKRADWIAKKKAYFELYKNKISKEYVSGENFCYLGKNYRLKVIEANEECVKLQRGYLQLFVKDKNNTKRKRELIDSWYKQKAKIYFEKIILQYQPIIKQDIKSLKIRKMKTRWGSCNASKKSINLNLNLIEKPKECIEYVIFHELAHLIHPNHSKKFYNYLDIYMNDWKRRKEKLESLYFV